MTRTANIHEAKTNLSKLIDAAQRGEEVVIARNGVPVVKLVAVEKPDETKDTPAKRIMGMWAGKVTIHDPHWWKPDDELADLFENSVIYPPDPDDAAR
ncbi:type II toxin-antitoxin system prevent-host-death family antitoxin [Starkeya sp. ORNL1]|uniref:type II toxin-antitoxin system Phd/YefM family antitoxin n=1 Tax=Starkeya sp. ORNL1 TaxID=2709380 RepID=UPI001462BF77|nr:type II toxin-antitoxin system prevent-host-death family antitoxin [Starkeya sp. ORNL1]QJP12197.1 type II toxin-antitoxin system prevent-host-death family antitoxin [Starkeya sp. ORNL1]